MLASDNESDWKFTDPAEREYEKLQPHEQERIVSKLDRIGVGVTLLAGTCLCMCATKY